MSAPDLEAVLTELVALEQEAYADPIYGAEKMADILYSRWPFLHAKLQAAMEMEKALEHGRNMWGHAYGCVNETHSEQCAPFCQEQLMALAAWQKAGEDAAADAME